MQEVSVTEAPAKPKTIPQWRLNLARRYGLSQQTLDDFFLQWGGKSAGYHGSQMGFEYPVTDATGKVLYWQWKNAEKGSKPKYYTAEGVNGLVIYNISALRKAGNEDKAIWIANGAPTTWVMHQIGINAIAVPSGEKVPARALEILTSYGITDVHLAPDYDLDKDTGKRDLKKGGIAHAKAWAAALAGSPIRLHLYDLHAAASQWLDTVPTGFDIADLLLIRDLDSNGVLSTNSQKILADLPALELPAEPPAPSLDDYFAEPPAPSSTEITDAINPAVIEALRTYALRDFRGRIPSSRWIPILCPHGHKDDHPGKHCRLNPEGTGANCFSHGSIGAMELCRAWNIDIAALGGLYVKETTTTSKAVNLSAAPPDVPAPPAPEKKVMEGETFNLTDMGNAERLIARFGDEMLYCRAWKSWVTWDGTRWQMDETGAVERMAKMTVRMIPDEAPTKGKKRDAVLKHAIKSESASRLEAMVRVARSDEKVITKPDTFDTDTWLLNCQNCLIDLRDMRVMPHQKEHRLMKQVQAFYDPKAKAPTWEKFLHKVMAGNENLIAFLQRAIGYSLTGETREQVIFFLHGRGSNGKSTMLETLRYVLGDYSKNTPTSTLMRRGDSSSVNNDIARLPGVRLVTAIETDDNQQLSEATVKAITGGDTITTRFLFSEFFEFKPAFKVFLACNHKPVITGVDNGIWRRIRLIPFSVIFEEHEKDMTLPFKLQAEASGILNWALQGCAAWQKNGLGVPPEVADAVNEYRGEMDVLAGFLNDRCVINRNAVAPAIDLYEAYTEWADSNGERAQSQRTFGMKLSERGFEKRRSGQTGNYVWQGVGLKTERSEPSE